MSRVNPPLVPPRASAKFMCFKNSLVGLSDERVYSEAELLTQHTSGKPVACAIGPVLDYTPHIVDQSIGNWVRGMRKRCVHEQHIEHGTMSRFADFVDAYVQRFVPLPYIEPSHEFLDTWLENSKYTTKQKKMFHKKLDEFMDPRVSKHKLFEIKSFIKREFYGETKEPRIINGPSEMLKAVVAPYVKAMEEQVYDEHYIKHTSRMGVAAKMQRIKDKFSLLYETDYTSFEGTFTCELMQACELKLFKRLLLNNPKIYNIIKETDIGKHIARARFNPDYGKCEFYGSRLSGCLWTSLGNGFTNQMVIEFIRKCTSKHTKTPPIIDYLVEGDDGLIGSSTKLDWDIANMLGLKLKVKESHDFNELSFCGLCLGPQGLMPGSFTRVIEKFGFTTDAEMLRPENHHRPYIQKLGRELIKAKAMSLLASNKAVPILQTLACKVMELTSGEKVSFRHFNYYWEIEMQNVLRESLLPIEVSMESRRFFEARFNISVAEQLEIENRIMHMDSLFTVMEI